MYGTTAIPVPARHGKSAYRRVKKLIRELDDTDDDEDSVTGTGGGISQFSSTASLMAPSISAVDPKKPWLKEFNHYLNTMDEIPDGLDVVQWWGVSAYLI